MVAGAAFQVSEADRVFLRDEVAQRHRGAFGGGGGDVRVSPGVWRKVRGGGGGGGATFKDVLSTEGVRFGTSCKSVSLALKLINLKRSFFKSYLEK